VILALPESEFRLEKESFPRQEAALHRSRHRLSNGGFVIVAALVGGINTPETLAQGEFGHSPCLIFLPGRTVQETGHEHTVDQQDAVVVGDRDTLGASIIAAHGVSFRHRQLTIELGPFSRTW